MNFDELSELGIEELFKALGCKSLLETKEITYPRLVQAFYAYLECDACNDDVKMKAKLLILTEVFYQPY